MLGKPPASLSHGGNLSQHGERDKGGGGNGEEDLTHGVHSVNLVKARCTREALRTHLVSGLGDAGNLGQGWKHDESSGSDGKDNLTHGVHSTIW